MKQTMSCEQAISEIISRANELVYGNFSSPVCKSNPISKITIKSVMLKSRLNLQLASFDQTKCYTKNFPLDDSVGQLAMHLRDYAKLFLRFRNEEWDCFIDHDRVRMSKRALEQEQIPDQVHNRKKQYLLQEGQPIDFLVALGVMSKDGRIKGGMQDKFTQINRFLEIVNDLSDTWQDQKELCIVDLGCGKAILSFALYYLFEKIYGKSVRLIGIDLKQDMVEQCNRLATELGYTGLSFRAQSIEEVQLDCSVDIVVALHACDVASDAAIYKAISWDAKAFFIAPCCQHEVSSQIDETAFPIMLQHGLFKEHFCALFTDALRVKLLEAIGFKVQVVEFVDPVHTPKNILIRAVRQSNDMQKNAWNTYRKYVTEYGLHPSLERLLSQGGLLDASFAQRKPK